VLAPWTSTGPVAQLRTPPRRIAARRVIVPRRASCTDPAGEESVEEAEPSGPRPGSAAGRILAGRAEGDTILAAEPVDLRRKAAHRGQIERVGHRLDLLVVQVQNPQVAELGRGAHPLLQALGRRHPQGDPLAGGRPDDSSVTGIPVGLGSHVHWDRKLDARLAGCPDGYPGDQGCRDR
jgi:hypothetical protein